MASLFDEIVATASWPSILAVHGQTVTYGASSVSAVFVEIATRDVSGQDGTWRHRTAKLELSTAATGGVPTAGAKGDTVTIGGDVWAVAGVIERHPGANLISLALERREKIEETGPKFRRDRRAEWAL